MFAWAKLRQSVHEFVKQCQICLQAKPDRSAYPGKLQPLPVPHTACHTISLDFVEGLPRSGTADCILVVGDKFTKFSHFLPLSHPYTAAFVAQLFLSQVYRLHGFPMSVISDRDPVFTSQFWQSLFKLAGAELCMSSSYHPNPMAKLKESISASKHSYAALSVPVLKSGLCGSPRLNSSTTQASTHPWALHPLKYSMVANRILLVFHMVLLFPVHYQNGCMSAPRCRI
jgi:hypothetical protein